MIRSTVAAALACVICAGTAAMPAWAGAAPDDVSRDVSVGIDQARALRLDTDAAAVAVGNPSIADAVVQQSDLILLIGRSFGATNVLVFDRAGNQTASFLVNVVDVSPRQVTLNRGRGRYSYNCAPRCEAILKVGDAPEWVDMVVGQTGAEQGLAAGSAETTASGDGQ